MVGNVARSYRPRLGIQQPLRERWETLRERVSHALPNQHPDRSVLQLPCDEWAVDAMEDALTKYESDKAAADYEPPSAALKAAFDEIGDLRRRYARAHAELLERQKTIRRVANDRVHLIMRDIPVNALDEFPPMSLSVDNHPRYSISSIAAARKEAGEQLTRTMFIEGLVRQLRDALHFHSLPESERALLLIDALHDGLQVVFARIEALEEKLAPPKSKLERRKSKRPPKAAATSTRSSQIFGVSQ
jgi:hypothetical protein